MTALSKATRDEQLRDALLCPVRAAKPIFGADLTSTQALILRSLVTNRRTSVKGCTGFGKTFTAALAAAWWIVRYKDSVVLTTATNWIQVEKQLWVEIRKLAAVMRIKVPMPLKTSWEISPGRQAIGISSNHEEAYGGWHRAHTLVIPDESSGLSDEVYTGLEGPMSAGHARMLELGNPLDASGPFYDHHTRGRGDYYCISVSCFDTPNFSPIRKACNETGLIGREALTWMLDRLMSMDERQRHAMITHPHLTSPVWVADKFEDWGPDHPKFQARCLGQFPAYRDSALIPLSWIEDAEMRASEDDGITEIEVGIDVAGPGKNETVVCVRAGRKILGIWAFNEADARGPVAAVVMRYNGRVRSVKVDAIGIGTYFVEHLRDLGLKVEPVNVSIPAPDLDDAGDQRFANMRAKLAWQLRERFEAGDIDGLEDDDTSSECAAIEYDHDPRGRIRIQAKKKTTHGWDRFDALVLAFARIQPAIEVVQHLVLPSAARSSTSYARVSGGGAGRRRRSTGRFRSGD